ncbi:DUF6731 family protein [Bradyrhizobium sp. SZCCHNRI3052]|uniref:DUF6731 family protein n=1 Tax=Bradyrhizobium sp. SZCCHNRI3052 TaxID=3057295 RepID=UPI002916F6B4|nr:DUF6731 family protein [Bradyrhizobium sp. SZCCHNRI3052]
MDKTISFRFFNVTRHQRSRHTFSQVLQQIGAIPRARDRERQLAVDYHVRAEIIESALGSIHGEITRIQRTNYPSEVEENGRRALRVRNPLGHGVVFRYLPGSNTLGMQYDARVLSPARFASYISNMIDGANFEFEPIVRNDLWDQFNRSVVRKISIAIAQPTHLQAVDRGGAVAIAQSMKNLGEAYSAPKINIELSMGHSRGGLSETVKSMVRHFRTQAVQDQVEVTAIKARVQQEDDKPEDLDLLEDILATRERLELHDNDPEANYRIKLSALREKMNEWV